MEHTDHVILQHMKDGTNKVHLHRVKHPADLEDIMSNVEDEHTAFVVSMSRDEATSLAMELNSVARTIV